jgi:nitrogen fixation NifU-like protein
MSDLRALYQELIVDHGQHPRNFYAMQHATASQEGFNPLCGDRLTLFLHIADDKIIDMSFQGSGCAISMASCSLMIELLKGKTLQAVRTIAEAFHATLVYKDESQLELLGKCAVLKGVCEYPSRIKCATLAWHTLKGIVS